MTANGSHGRGALALVGVLLTLFVVFIPTIVFGEAASPLGFVGLGIVGLVAGVLLRVNGRGDTRRFGSWLAIAGGLLLVAGGALTALAFGGWGRPY